MLSRSDFVAVCPILTRETHQMLNAVAFAAIKPGAYLINVARGEIIDNAALAGALTGGRLAGAYLDVWDDDINSPPPPQLLEAPNLVLTPHVAGRNEGNQNFSLDLFRDNLARLLRNQELINVIDWQRGY